MWDGDCALPGTEITLDFRSKPTVWDGDLLELAGLIGRLRGSKPTVWDGDIVSNFLTSFILMVLSPLCGMETILYHPQCQEL